MRAVSCLTGWIMRANCWCLSLMWESKGYARMSSVIVFYQETEALSAPSCARVYYRHNHQPASCSIHFAWTSRCLLKSTWVTAGRDARLLTSPGSHPPDEMRLHAERQIELLLYIWRRTAVRYSCGLPAIDWKLSHLNQTELCEKMFRCALSGQEQNELKVLNYFQV